MKNISFLNVDPTEPYLYKRESLVVSFINFQIKNCFYHMQCCYPWQMGVAGIGLDRSCVDVCMCSSCVVVKGAVSVRPSVTGTHTLPHRRMCG